MKTERGCEKDAPFPVFSLDKMQYFRCPFHYIQDGEAIWFLRMFNHYKNGLLPVAGGILDQSNIFLEAMEILEHEERVNGVKKQ